MAGGTRSKSSTSTNIDPTQSLYLQKGWQAAAPILNQPIGYYPGQTVAGQDAATLQGYESRLAQANQGMSGINAASQYGQDALSGMYASPESNPYLRGTYDQAARAVTENYRDSVIPGIQSRFALAGQQRSGGRVGAFGRANEGLAQGLGDLATNIYGGAYEAERGRMEAAASRAPTLADAGYQAASGYSQVGSEREQYQQQLLDELIQRFEFARDEPAQRIARYLELIGQPTTVSRGKEESLSLNIL